MRDVAGILDQLLAAHPVVTNRQLAQALGVSRGHASRLARRLVDLGHLRYTDGPRSKLVAGWAKERAAADPLAGTTLTGTFWQEVAQAFPPLTYVQVAKHTHERPRLRSDARALVEASGSARFIVADFANVTSASDAFLCELVDL